MNSPKKIDLEHLFYLSVTQYQRISGHPMKLERWEIQNGWKEILCTTCGLNYRTYCYKTFNKINKGTSYLYWYYGYPEFWWNRTTVFGMDINPRILELTPIFRDQDKTCVEGRLPHVWLCGVLTSSPEVAGTCRYQGWDTGLHGLRIRSGLTIPVLLCNFSVWHGHMFFGNLSLGFWSSTMWTCVRVWTQLIQL